jgi:hypothetical protein
MGTIPSHALPTGPCEAVVLEAALRSRCEQRLADLRLPVPFALEAFCDELALRRGKPLTIVDMPSADDGGPSGAWLATDDADYVFVDQSARALHREHIVLHELAHMIFDHSGAPALGDSDAAALLPAFDSDTVARVLGRSRYTDVEEQEAELLATMIAERASRERQVAGGPDEVLAIRDRLHRALG